ncbi:hypothetical protein TSUD_391340 [Trifolium subterraneum]|uniref:PHD-type zinc finger plants domain-containing protein n=1 Tax=Trifolium subterraneum TaxID=3900 RepID=A0A2Z6MM04_TRISU|nr:hypothetical protein TSUD_391340 [Trifolium subterraneum]
MVDHQIVCCMCGDVGFTDKLFRCNKCRHRYQHSNFYGELAEIEECDWCQTESAGKNTCIANSSNSKKPAVTVTINHSNSGCSKKLDHHSEKRKSPVPSPRHATRRYKLLKDVMC